MTDSGHSAHARSALDVDETTASTSDDFSPRPLSSRLVWSRSRERKHLSYVNLGVILTLGSIFLYTMVADLVRDGHANYESMTVSKEAFKKAVRSISGLHSAKQGKEQLAVSLRKSLPNYRKPRVISVKSSSSIMRASGGDPLTIYGKNLGDFDADVSVRIGNTVAESTQWVDERTLVVRTPAGVGKDLDVTVTVSEPAFIPAVAVGKQMFRYSAPFVFDVEPFIVGEPIYGPMDLNIRVWGVGNWDTKPEAQINGQACGKTTWIDNSTVRCTTVAGSKLTLQNPEVKVGGQRSRCGIISPGVCTLSLDHASAASVGKIEKDIEEMRARGVSTKAAWKQLRNAKQMNSYWADRNSDDNPCNNLPHCRHYTFFSAILSAILMMFGMASICLVLYVIPQIVMWLKTELLGPELELDENDPKNYEALREMEFDSRIRLR
uniref:IPT/TIG domain-containing protein n=1 Tax=Guillardia theta TaxID=55529 RepID=A0A7S4KM81_GUITH|mmetsp:Transcript_26813/g.87789  ORF Transcript_26813/g.87789 Transcript_26813/m.87789 type:complete len:436 (+) Transcript_26813:327-1634(+)